MALLHTYTFNTTEKILRINTDKVNGISRDLQAVGLHLVCASITGTGSVELQEGNTDDEAQAVDVSIIDPADGSATQVTQAISTGNFKINYFGADAAKNLYLRFPATLTGGTCAIHANYEFETSDDS